MVEYTLKAKRLYSENDEEIFSSHLSYFAFSGTLSRIAIINS